MPIWKLIVRVSFRCPTKCRILNTLHMDVVYRRKVKGQNFHKLITIFMVTFGFNMENAPKEVCYCPCSGSWNSPWILRKYCETFNLSMLGLWPVEKALSKPLHPLHPLFSNSHKSQVDSKFTWMDFGFLYSWLLFHVMLSWPRLCHCKCNKQRMRCNRTLLHGVLC